LTHALSHTAHTPADVVIVGAGLAGSAAATLLARQGVRVTLIDPWRSFPDLFRAEKIEPDQIALLRQFGLLDALLPHAGHIHQVWEAENGRVLCVEHREQFGVSYQNMVNGVRATLPADVDFIVGRVEKIANAGDVQCVTLAGGQECTARIVAVACGTGGELHARLGIQRRMIQKDQSLAFAFTIARADGSPFPFEALTYYPDGSADRVFYLTLFRMGTVMRANLFVCWSGNDASTRTFVREPRTELTRMLPKLTGVIGEVDVVSRVETGRVDLFRAEGLDQAGVVLLADAFESVCPTTGMGLTKVLTDVDVFCHECMPRWLATPRIGAQALAGYYDHPRKRQVDDDSLSVAWANRQLAVSNALPWRLRRAKRRWMMQASGWWTTSGSPGS
jgi:2-polyprenyl-6-methoxyphenol hydroxylase-like FAD-dependent oxidoreductase